MKYFTKNLVLFSILLAVITIIFRYALSSLLQNQHFSVIWVITILYAILIFSLGWIFGKRDRIAFAWYDVGFRFHLNTYIICNAIAFIWFTLGFQSDYEKITSVYSTLLYWGLGLLIHFIIYLYTRKNSIKGIQKSELFE